MTVRELGERMDSAELAEWMAYYRLEPFGEERADLRTATVALAVYTAAGFKGVKLSDVMLKYDSEGDRSPASMRKALLQSGLFKQQG